jgi:pimeloyl-ACP methyl ester carboxylesterase
MDMQSGTIAAPGAHLYFEKRGAGPALLLIPGGPADAGAFSVLAEALGGRFTTIAYDPRGNSRSTLLGAPTDQDIDVHAEDAVALLDHLNFARGFVFGTSGGAQIGLNMAARFPERVKTLVAHEPPCLRLAPDAAELADFVNRTFEAYRQGGVEEGMKAFFEGVGLGNPMARQGAAPPPPSPEMQETFARIGGNRAFFLEHGLKPISLFLPDVEALRSGPTRIVIGIGANSAGQLARRTALALADHLGTQPVTFPGDHIGYGQDPQPFAEILSRTLEAR